MTRGHSAAAATAAAAAAAAASAVPGDVLGALASFSALPPAAAAGATTALLAAEAANGAYERLCALAPGGLTWTNVMAARAAPGAPLTLCAPSARAHALDALGVVLQRHALDVRRSSDGFPDAVPASDGFPDAVPAAASSASSSSSSLVARPGTGVPPVPPAASVPASAIPPSPVPRAHAAPVGDGSTLLLHDLRAARSAEREAEERRVAQARNCAARRAARAATGAEREAAMGVQAALRAVLSSPGVADALHAPFAAGAGASASSSSASSSSASASLLTLPRPQYADFFVRSGGGASFWRSASIAPPRSAQARGMRPLFSVGELEAMAALSRLPHVRAVVLAGSPSAVMPYAGRRLGRPARTPPTRAFREAVLRASLAFALRAEALGVGVATSSVRAAAASGGVPGAPAVAAAALRTRRAHRSLLDCIDDASDPDGDFTDGTAGELGASDDDDEGDSEGDVGR